MQMEIVEISSGSCANCYALLPVAKKLADEKGIPFRHIEITESSAEEVKGYGIDRVPALAVVANGKVIARCCGYQPEEILSLWLDAKIEQAAKEKQAGEEL